MKKLIPLLSFLALCSYGCRDNKDQVQQKEEEIHSRDQQYNMNDANITTPIDSRPDLEEED